MLPKGISCFKVRFTLSFVGKSIKNYLPFYLRLIKALPLKFWKVLRNNFQKSQMERSLINESGEVIACDYRKRLGVTLKTVKFICLQAFIDTMRPKQTKFSPLLALLIRQIRQYGDISEIELNGKLRSYGKILKLIKL